MSTFDLAIPVILQHEGGWVSNPADPGGETNFGISTLIIKRENITADKLGVDPTTMFQPGYLKLMKVDAAKDLYKSLFWDRFKYGMLDNQTVATKVFDCSVNCGPMRANGMAQRAANDCGQQLLTDGMLGPVSMAGINACDPTAWVKAMVGEMTKYYTNLVNNKPSLAVFERNWLKRAAWGI